MPAPEATPTAALQNLAPENAPVVKKALSGDPWAMRQAVEKGGTVYTAITRQLAVEILVWNIRGMVINTPADNGGATTRHAHSTEAIGKFLHFLVPNHGNIR